MLCMAHLALVRILTLDSSDPSNRYQETNDRALSAITPAQISEPSIPDPTNHITPGRAYVNDRSPKRKRFDSATSLEAERTAEAVEKSSTDEEPTTKKRKTRSSASTPEEFLELGSDHEDDVVVTPRNRKTAKARASKAAADGSKPAGKSHKDSEFERLIKQEEKRKASAAGKNIFARNPKLKRSFADTVSASRMSRPRPNLPTHVMTIAPPPKITRRLVVKDSSTAEVAPSAVAEDEKEIHVDLRTIKYLNVTDNIRNVHISRIVESPFAYPNVKIDFDEKNRPIKAHITKMTSEEYKLACDQALKYEKDARKLDAKLARQNKFNTKKSSLHKTAGCKVAEKSSLHKAASGKGTKKPSLNKVSSGKIIRQPRKSRAQS
jgi:hypothetical protein